MIEARFLFSSDIVLFDFWQLYGLIFLDDVISEMVIYL